MAWRESNRVCERQEFIDLYEAGESTMTELCAAFGVSRMTGYRLVKRYVQEGDDGFFDRSRAPRRRPTQTPPDVEARIVVLRIKRPTWGSKKILAVLERESPNTTWPARSTIDAILKREGLVIDRPRRVDRRYRASPVMQADRPNAVWTADFKGWFRLGDGTRCEPLTINDMFSRYSLACRAFRKPAGLDVQRALQECFQEYGLPQVILTDNGPPFGSIGIRSLTWLSVWLLRLGVLPSHIQPGKPQQNGKHERFHLTLKRDAASPPKFSKKAQQREIDRFRQIYNNERPHEALAMLTPVEIYESSPRPYEGDPGDFEYPCNMDTRRVRVRGHMNWNNEPVYIGEAMRKQLVGLEPIGQGVWRVWVGPLAIGVLDVNEPKLKLRQQETGSKPRR